MDDSTFGRHAHLAGPVTANKSTSWRWARGTIATGPCRTLLRPAGLRVAIAAVLLAVGSVHPATSQRLRGRLLDVESNQPSACSGQPDSAGVSLGGEHSENRSGTRAFLLRVEYIERIVLELVGLRLKLPQTCPGSTDPHDSLVARKEPRHVPHAIRATVFEAVRPRIEAIQSARKHATDP